MDNNIDSPFNTKNAIKLQILLIHLLNDITITEYNLVEQYFHTFVLKTWNLMNMYCNMSSNEEKLEFYDISFDWLFTLIGHNANLDKLLGLNIPQLLFQILVLSQKKIESDDKLIIYEENILYSNNMDSLIRKKSGSDEIEKSKSDIS